MSLLTPSNSDSTGRHSNNLLLLTKLQAPKQRANILERPRLFRKLDEGREGILTLVTAPAGFGKSTLLNQWLGQISTPAAWLSLDETDNDPKQFWTYLIASIKTKVPSFGSYAHELLQSPRNLPITAVLTELVNDLSEREGLVLVIDDYHLITQPDIHSGVTFILDHAPPSLHLVIASRSDPPLPLSRLRARGQLCEIPAADLRASKEEAYAFLTQVMKLDLSPENAGRLGVRTEGWLAGLQLAALSLQGREDVSSFIASFSGDNRYVLDYLTEEVLRKQPQEVQRFLLQTSVLERLCAPLCDAVMEQEQSQGILETLEGENVFTLALDDRREWYRYHALFAELLRHRLIALNGSLVPELQRRAALWCAKQGHRDEAIGYALDSGDYALVARLLERYAKEMRTAGRTNTLISWFDAVPEEVVKRHPQLGLGKAWAALTAEQPQAASAQLEEVEKALALYPSSTPTDLVGEMAVMRAILTSYRHHPEEAIKLSNEALERLPPEDAWVRGVVAMNLANAHYVAGNFKATWEAIRYAHRLNEAAGNQYAMLVTQVALADVARWQGRFKQAEKEYRLALKLAERGGRRMPMAGRAFVGLGKLMLEKHELEAARSYIQEGLDLAKAPQRGVFLEGRLHLALVLHALGEREGAHSLLDEVQEAAGREGVSILRDGQGDLSRRAVTFRTQLRLDEGRIDEALGWLKSSGFSADDDINHLCHIEYLTVARVLIVSKRIDEALALLTRLRKRAEAERRLWHRLEAMVFQALALSNKRDSTLALTLLEEALVLAENERHARPFVEAGGVLKPLLTRLSPGSPAGHYAKELQLRRDGGSRSAPALAEAVRDAEGVLIEPLSEREFTVLRLLVGGMSNKELARKTYVSVNTIKTHVRNIYGKLNVSSRAQLVARVSELELLS